jgi:hypothetical protein
MAARRHHIISVGKRVNAMTTEFKKPERPEGLPACGAAWMLTGVHTPRTLGAQLVDQAKARGTYRTKIAALPDMDRPGAALRYATLGGNPVLLCGGGWGIGLTAKWHTMGAWRDLNDVETATLISAASFHERWQPEEMTQ